MLKLKIENHARLPDGGPLAYEVDRRGFDIGRDQHLDWTLPDPTRHISSKHCEIRFFDGTYWLYDVSTNGTFVNKSTRRIQSPYKLADGDELIIGEYIISVSVKGSPSSRPRSRPAEVVPDRRSADPDNIWSGIGEPPPPINPQALLPPVQRQSRAADFLNSVANVPAVSARPKEVATSFPSGEDPWAVGGAGGQASAGFRAEPFVSREADRALGAGGSDVFALSEPAPPLPSPDVPRPGPVSDRRAAFPGPTSSDPGRQPTGREFIRQFAAGANIPEAALAGREADELAQEIGSLLRIVCANLMQLLSARAATKTLARSGNRTLIKPVDNNPLKFTPSPEEALKIMLGPRSQSYLDAVNTLELSFADLKTHQLGVVAAMQAAAAQLLEELSPQAIEQAGGGAKKSLLGGNKARLWEIFVERWTSKSGHHEHGMLGEFLERFAQSYDRETRQKR